MKNTERFSGRVDHYVKHRPGYPKELMDFIYDEVGLSANAFVADIGAGTGIFTKLLLERGSRVYAVEPNQEMADAAYTALNQYETYYPVYGTAEDTTLSDASMDYVTCAQSFHWFDRGACKKEFHRILRPGGKALLVWYKMFSEGSDFTKAYEKLHYDFSSSRRTVDLRNIGDKELIAFFKDGNFGRKYCNYTHKLDFEGLKGREFSSSHAPLLNDENYTKMLKELEKLFITFESDGEVEFLYRAELYYGAV